MADETDDSLKVMRHPSLDEVYPSSQHPELYKDITKDPRLDEMMMYKDYRPKSSSNKMYYKAPKKQ